MNKWMNEWMNDCLTTNLTFIDIFISLTLDKIGSHEIWSDPPSFYKIHHLSTKSAINIKYPPFI